jgi:hypothetical protein
MPPTNNLDYQCDWRFGFNVDPKKKAAVGYLLFWSGCGGLTLPQDIQVWNPFSSSGQTIVSGATVECIGMIDKFSYQGGSDDPIRISTYLSKGAAANLRAKLASPLTTTKLKVGWYIIDFDGEKKTWYEAALIKDASGSVNAVLDTMNGDLQLFVSNEPVALSPQLDIHLYRAEFQIVPADGATANLEFATGPTTRVVRQWAKAAS